MDRKEKIIEYMKSPEYIPLKEEELIQVLCVPKSDVAEFSALLNQLVTEGKILPVKKQRYKAADKSVVTGTLRCSKHSFFAFLLTDESGEDVFIPGEALADAVDGDFAAVSLNRTQRGERREGRVVCVIKRGNKTLSGVITKATKKLFFIKPDNSGFFTQITAPVSELAKVGDRVILDIVEYQKNGDMLCNISANLGSKDDFMTSVNAAICEYGVKCEFDEETLSEAKNAPTEVSDISDRRDLRKLLTFTIDGDDARDFDDAVSCERLENNNFMLGVHIADVTHYVAEGSALDTEAFSRGTSVYLPHKVIPMLPKELSNGICSLNPNVDRYALSVFMEIDKSGNVLSHELVKSVICSDYRLTYSLAKELLEGEDEELKKEYRKIMPTLKRMKRLAGYLYKKRDVRGSIDFELPEAEIHVDENGNPVSVREAERNIAHKIIEEFMLSANETIAEYAFWAELPFVYRVHAAPTPEKMQSFSDFIFNFGLTVKGRKDREEGVHPKALQNILKAIKDLPEQEMISKYLLRSLMKAEYQSTNLGHFGLAAKYYCHFTSPIRRYPDLIIHRILKDFISGKSLDAYYGVVDDAASNSSKTERNAMLLERSVDDIMKAQYMKSHIGEIFSAKVSGVTNFGIFAELENTCEGLLRLENMHDDYYMYDENRRIVIGKRKKRTYKIGDPISIMVAKCDTVSGSIDFLPANATLKDINDYYNNKKSQTDSMQNNRRKSRSKKNR